MLQHVNGSKDPHKRRATYEDLLAVPDHLIAEIIDGELIVSPHPASRHALATSVLGFLLGMPLQIAERGPRGWWIIDEPELHLNEDILVPDLAGWRRERMQEYPDVKFFIMAPDWICEVLSPSTVKIDRSKKLRIYSREGVRHAWFVDPAARSVEIYTLKGADLMMHAIHAGDERIRAVPFESVEIPLAYLWGETTVPSEQPASGT
jgi:Uma2 family endonuclease